MYRVLEDFIDTDGVAYYKGDFYPVLLMNDINKNHIDYLTSNKNKLNKPVIEEVKLDENNKDNSKEVEKQILETEELTSNVDKTKGKNKGKNLKNDLLNKKEVEEDEK